MKDIEAILQKAASEWNASVTETVAESERQSMAMLRRQTLTNRVAYGTGIVGVIIFGCALCFQQPSATNQMQAPSVQSTHANQSVGGNPGASQGMQQHNVSQPDNIDTDRDLGIGSDKRTARYVGERNVGVGRSSEEVRSVSSDSYVEVETKAGGFNDEYARIIKIIDGLPSHDHLALMREHRGVARLCVRWSKFELADKHLRLALSEANTIGDPAVVRSVMDQMSRVRQ